MATFQTNKETQASIENIISNAEKQLILVSPYIKLTNTLFTRLKSCAERGVIVKIIYRTGELKDDGVSRLATHKNVELRSTDNLHAKCYFNEKEMIVTSLNLLESSEKNWEMGVLIDRIDDKVMFEKAMREVHIIFNGSNSHSTSSTSSNFQKKLKSNSVARPNSKDGYCIRCEGNILFNKEKPLCRDCFTSWNEWQDEEYPENYCHFSGKESDGETCFSKPILKINWKEAKKIHGF
jgi:phosphatidylserine/phosphatidylglycerophosphate/cardiolipin synthase-like enzyme